MKKNLGKLLFILLILQVNLFAQELVSYELSANKTDAFVREAIEITFKADQKDHSHIMSFFLEPKKSDDYKIIFLTKEIHDKKHHDSSVLFKYIVFPLKAKVLNIDFDFNIKTSNEQNLAQAYVTDHDESSAIEGIVSLIKINPLKINVKPLTQEVDLVGDFHLQSSIDTKKIKSYESVNLHYILKGIGYNNSINLLNQIKKVSLFKDINSQSEKLTKSGYKINRDYIYALSAKSSFIVPSILLKAYSPTQHRFYELHTPSYDISVTQIDSSTLVDKEDKPYKKSLLTFKTFKQWSIYLFIFISGFILAKVTEINIYTKKSEKFQDIKKSGNPQELILILLNNYQNREIKKWIEQLEKVAYGKDGKSFKQIKKELLQKFM